MLLLLLYGCVSAEYKNEGETYIQPINFDKVYELKGEQILKNDIDGVAIYVIDTLLMLKSDSKLVHYNIYGKNSQQFLGSLGIKGDKREAWNKISYNEQYFIENNEIKIWLSDHIKGKLLLINLSKQIVSKKPLPQIEKELNINIRKFPFTKALMISDSIVVGNAGYFEEERSRIKKINPQTQLVQKSDLFPAIKNMKFLPSDELYFFYGTPILKHPTKELYVSALPYFNRIDFFNSNLKLYNSAVEGNSWQDNWLDAKLLNPEEGFRNELDVFYMFTTASSKHVFCLYYGQPEKEYGEKLIPTQIRVFDWEGRPKYLLKIPNYLMNISISPSEDKLYGVAFFEEKILSYNLPKNLSK